MTGFANPFAALDAPRARNARRHSLHDILVIASQPCSAAARPAPI